MDLLYLISIICYYQSKPIMTKEDVLHRFALGIQKFHNEIPINLIKRKLEWITTQGMEDAIYMVKIEIPFQEYVHKFGLFREDGDFKVRFVGKEPKGRKRAQTIPSA